MAALDLPPGLCWRPLRRDDLPAVDRALPDGYAIRPLRPGQDERAAYEVVEQAFSEWPDREPTLHEDWAATVLQRPGFEPWQLTLAVDRSGDVVGACHLVLSADTGWVNQVAVDRAHGGRGIAHALLAQAFAAAREPLEAGRRLAWRGARRDEVAAAGAGRRRGRLHVRARAPLGRAGTGVPVSLALAVTAAALSLGHRTGPCAAPAADGAGPCRARRPDHPVRADDPQQRRER